MAEHFDVHLHFFRMHFVPLIKFTATCFIFSCRCMTKRLLKCLHSFFNSYLFAYFNVSLFRPFLSRKLVCSCANLNFSLILFDMVFNVSIFIKKPTVFDVHNFCFLSWFFFLCIFSLTSINMSPSVYVWTSILLIKYFKKPHSK